MMPNQPQAYAPGLYGLVGGVVNVYLLDDGEAGLTVIDAGLPGAARRILGLVRTLGRAPSDVRHILVTHADVDHVGSLKPLVTATGAAVYASAESEKYIRRCANPPHISFPMTVPSAIINRLFRRAVKVDHVVTDGERLSIAGGIQVIATPGHTPDHVSYFWERERVLLVGDLLNTLNGLVLTPPRITWNRAAAQTSARRVLALNPAVICPGHGQVWSFAQHPEQLEVLLAALPGRGAPGQA